MIRRTKKSRVLRLLKISIYKKFNLHLDKANENDVVEGIVRNTNFIGANLWTLIFAIFIASIGLNVNSAAVIIGAMLISPLMGPIMGVGLGIGIVDFELVKKGTRSLLIASLIGIATSTVYFLITPLQEAQSELLARTTPSIWDVFIAFFGGLAGIVAGTRKEKSTVIPGVAIATALMPPLCTAGFGLATGNFLYFFGALYLYFINSVFICISTFLIVRFLRFRKKEFEDAQRAKRVSRYIFLIILFTIIPSLYLTYGIVGKSIFENNAKKFVREQFNFRNTQVVNRSYNYDRKEIELLLIGYEIPVSTQDSIKKNLGRYNLNGVHLLIRQGLNAKSEIDLLQVKASILEDVFKKDSSRHLKNGGQLYTQIPDISSEIKALYPQMHAYSAEKTVIRQLDSLRMDTVIVVVVDFKKQPGKAERDKLQNWLKVRLNADSLRLIMQY